MPRAKRPVTKITNAAKTDREKAREKLSATTTALPWTKPLCSLCGEPIDEIMNAFTSWRCDRPDFRFTHPAVSHNPCSSELRDRGWNQDIPVEWFRRIPMQAVIVALNRHADTEEERLPWHAWLSIVLGLPFTRWDFMFMAIVEGEVGDYIPDRVPIAPGAWERSPAQAAGT